MPPSAALKPRKTPVQARSTHTVQAILQASVQVLTDVGAARLTTTRVALRAGVSVGTLYQYFPNKQALLAAVLEQHLESVVAAVEAACERHKGRSARAMAAAVAEAFLEAKFANPDASRSLYAVSPDVGGSDVVERLTRRSQVALCAMLASASDKRFDELTTVSYVLSTALIGPVQGLLVSEAPASAVRVVRRHLIALVHGYLEQAGTPKRHARPQR